MNFSSPLTPTPVAIVVGASSGIGEAVARKLAHEGYAVALVARRADRLHALCAELNARPGAAQAVAYPHDVTYFDEIPALFQTILRDLGRLNVMVYASGIMLPSGFSEYNFEKDRATLEVNVLGAMAWLGQAATYFEQAGEGHLVGISSVAGDRGRVGNPAYHTSKAALSTYLESLRNRLTRKGVHVLTVKPGYVDTDLLKAVARPFWVVSPEQAAADIWRAMRRGKQQIYTLSRWGLVMWVVRHMPSFIFRRLRF
ncbi:MAG: SDR family NAD(P)-dependent oxidoreductase [Chloroflexi bacterium]|nr:SDR family NAD(P)-dependent oxidoreductase [Chloroflexota bacterium]